MTTLKSTLSAVGKAILVALAVPYVVTILVHSLHGWPQSDKSYGRFSKQLWPPSRVLNFNYAFIQQLALLKLVPRVLHASSVHKEADPKFKDLPFGRKGLKMDIWPPKKVQQLELEGIPVVFFVYGGGWATGEKESYSTAGQEIADGLGAVVVIPDYSIYPKGNMGDMVLDIVESIHEFRSLYQSLNLPVDPDQIILMGHSAGAHLCTMTAIHAASNNRKITDGTVKMGSSTKSGVDQSGTKESDNRDKNREETSSTDEASNGVSPKSDLATAIRGVIPMGGVFHLMDYYQYATTQGMEDISTMWMAADGRQNFEKYSPTCIVPKLTEDQKRRLPPHLLVHAVDDPMAPAASSSSYAEVLVEAGVPTELKILERGGHADIFFDLMDPSREWYNFTMGILKEGTETFLGKV